jgi:hypothetical protein
MSKKTNPLGTKVVTREIVDDDIPRNRKQRRALSSKKSKPRTTLFKNRGDFEGIR